MLTRKQVADRIGVKPSWLAVNASEGPPFYRLGPQTIRYDESDVDDWLVAQSVKMPEDVAPSTHPAPPKVKDDVFIVEGMYRLRQSDINRFESRIRKTKDCWEWTGGRAGNHYGAIGIGGKTLSAHRVSYFLAYGDIPEGRDVDHKCRNRGCVNPDHLRAVTRKQNLENYNAGKRSTSGVRGVTWWPDREKWRAHVMHSGVQYYLGTFEDIEEAKRVVTAKRNELYTHNDMDKEVA